MSAPLVSMTMTSQLSECEKEFKRLLRQPASEWKLESNKRSVRVWSQTSDCRWKRFRASLTFEGVDPKFAFGELTEYPRRQLWDANIVSNATLASLGSKRVVTYTTPSAVGGLVKSRRFLDCSQETEAAGGALIGWCCDWTGDDAEHEALFDGLVRGRNLVGGGTAVKKLGESWQLTMIGFTDLGGGLPATIANSASVGAFVQLIDGLATQIEGKGGKRVPDTESFSLEF